MRVKSCEASDNQNRPIQLSDSDGCVLRPKMVSKFMKMRSTDPRATVVTYAFFHAFKFPDSMAVHIKCKVEICRYGCPDHCQSPVAYQAREQEVSSNLNNYQPTYNNNQRRVYQADPRTPVGGIYAPNAPNIPIPAALLGKEPRLARENSDLVQKMGQMEPEGVEDVGSAKTAEAGLPGFLNPLGLKLPELPKLPSFPNFFGGSEKKAQAKQDTQRPLPALGLGLKQDQDGSSSVPVHRTLNQEQPLVFPSSFNTASSHVRPIEPLYASTYDGLAIPYGPRALHVGADGKPLENRKRRAARVLSRTERSADIGVQSGYEVVSEVDLDFTPDQVEREVATFQVSFQKKFPKKLASF